MSYLRFSLFYGVSQETKAMVSLVARLDRLLYPDYSRNWDDALLRARILQHITPQSEVLDIGAGAGAVRQMNFRGLVSRVCGVDLDPRVSENPMLDEAKIADVEKIPYPDQTFDIVFANNLLEHLQDPLVVFREAERVLKRGGIFVFKTPNLYHYMPTLARLTSHRFHEWVNRIRGRAESDTFPTHYRANTRVAIERFGAASGLQVLRLGRIEGRPEYLRMFWPTYLLGAIYERLVNLSEFLAPFRILLIGELRKP